MPGFNPDNINIHDLTVEEPEKQVELPFDVERDITEKDWEEMKKELKSQRQENSWHQFAFEAMEMKLLFPDRVGELDVNEYAWERMKANLENQRNSGSANKLTHLLEQSVYMKMLFPEKFSEVNIDDIWEEVKKSFSQGEHFWTLTYTKVLFPERMHELNIDKNKVKKQIDDNFLEFFAKEGQWGAFAEHAMMAKVFYAENPKEINIDQNQWQNIKKSLENQRNGNQHNKWMEFTRLATAMKVLVAEKVEITDNGVELIMPGTKSLEVETPLVPEQRKF